MFYGKHFLSSHGIIKLHVLFSKKQRLASGVGIVLVPKILIISVQF